MTVMKVSRGRGQWEKKRRDTYNTFNNQNKKILNVKRKKESTVIFTGEILNFKCCI